MIKKHLNNKGYMLVEIILSSVLAMTVAYFIMDLTIKLKNKNDDLLVKTLVYTDQAIIYNEITEYLNQIGDDFSCDKIRDEITITYQKIKINEYQYTVTNYAKLGAIECIPNVDGLPSVGINIPLEVKQLPDEEFNIEINYYKVS